MSTLFLADLSWTEARERFAEQPIAMLPVGATEAHGPHLPLDTDVIIAVEAARRAAERLAAEGTPCLILPPLSYGVTFAAIPFPGTLTLRPDTLAAMLKDLVRSVQSHGARGVIVMSAHLEPIHFETLKGAATELMAEGIPTLVPDCRDPQWAASLTEEFRRGARHAGSYETSLVMASEPDQVRREHLQDLEPVWVDLPAALKAGARNFAQAGGTQAYFGDPARASSAEGERCYEALAEMLVQTAHGLPGVSDSE